VFILHRRIDFFQRMRYLHSFHLAVTTIVQNRVRHCEEGDTAKFPAVLHYLTPWLEPPPVGSSQFLLCSFGGRLLRCVCFFDLIPRPAFLIRLYVLLLSR
jgi:hypothetical protein